LPRHAWSFRYLKRCQRPIRTLIKGFHPHEKKPFTNSWGEKWKPWNYQGWERSDSNLRVDRKPQAESFPDKHELRQVKLKFEQKHRKSSLQLSRGYLKHPEPCEQKPRWRNNQQPQQFSSVVRESNQRHPYGRRTRLNG
jgi:hypothetical protein